MQQQQRADGDRCVIGCWITEEEEGKMLEILGLGAPDGDFCGTYHVDFTQPMSRLKGDSQDDTVGKGASF